MSRVLKPFDLRVVSLAYNSHLTNTVMDLQFLRRIPSWGIDPDEALLNWSSYLLTGLLEEMGA
jgi:hypothetical protein